MSTLDTTATLKIVTDQIEVTQEPMAFNEDSECEEFADSENSQTLLNLVLTYEALLRIKLMEEK
jgi:hypothetical protein